LSISGAGAYCPIDFPVTLTASASVSGGTYNWIPGGSGASLSVNPLVTTIYGLEYSIFGLTYSTTATVVVNQPITFNLAPSSATVCAGNPVTLTVSNVSQSTYNISWPSGAIPTGLNTAQFVTSTTQTLSVSVSETGFCPTAHTVAVNVIPNPIITVSDVTVCTGSAAYFTASGANTYSWSTGLIPTGVSSASITAVSNQTYSVTGTATNGCHADTTFNLNVLAAPILTVNSATICNGQTATLTANGATSYTWSAGANSTGINTADASPIVTSTYSVIGTALTCSTTATTTVTVNAIPIVTVLDATICNGQTATLTANGATSYTWSAGANSTGVNTASATPNTNTTYTVTGTTLGCSNTATSSVAVNPNPIVTVNDATICSGQTATLTANGATSYTWSSGANSTGINTANVSLNATSTFTVTGTNLGCSSTAVSTIAVNANPIVTVNNATICNGQTTTLTANGAISYVWSAGANSTGINTADANPNTTTTYTVVGSDGICTNQALANITVNAIPVVTVSDATICDGQTASLTANGATSYVWSAGANSTGVNTASATPNTNTTYTVTGTTLGCSNTATSTIAVNPNPIVTVNDATICSGQTAALTANGATSYTWSTGANSTGINTANASPITTSTFTVTGTSIGCSTTAVSTIAVNASPIITVNNATICNGQAATLTANGATSYVWSAGANSTGINTADANPNTTTSYTVIGTNNGCSTAANAVVTVNPIPSVTVNNITICEGLTALLTANGANSYVWSSGATASGVNTAIASPISTTTYSVTGTSLGCSNTTSATVTVLTLTISVTSATICEGDVANLTANGAITYTWSTGATATGVSSAIVFPATTETYTVTGSAFGCTAEAIATVIVNTLPIASFTAPPLLNLQNPVGNFNNNSTNSTSWLWDFGDANATSNTSTDQNPTHVFSGSGTYCITLTSYNNGCIDTTTWCLIVDDGFAFYIPSAFSPNGDANNNTFYGKGVGITEYELSIFDRWGLLIFKTDDINQHWDGKLAGQDAQQDVYVYVVNLKDNLHKDHKYEGTVTIVR
jgi:gliding motility-associated-like protein